MSNYKEKEKINKVTAHKKIILVQNKIRRLTNKVKIIRIVMHLKIKKNAAIIE